jgi:hypothetical protein
MAVSSSFSSKQRLCRPDREAEAHDGLEGLVNGGEDTDQGRYQQHGGGSEESDAEDEVADQDGVDDAVSMAAIQAWRTSPICWFSPRARRST